MVDFDILKQVGTTNERLREVLTATKPDKPTKLSKEEQENLDRDIKNRQRIEKLINSRLREHIVFTLRNHHIYSAVDLAWDSAPINKQTVPLVMYAQKRLSLDSCVSELSKLKVSDKFVRKSESGQPTQIDLPKFFETNINLVRSLITRRLSAQSNKYNNLYPFFKYDPRSTTATARLKGDVLSQRMDIMADQYDYRHFQTQCIRDMMLYGHSVAFPRASWEREVHWQRKNLSDEFEGSEIEKEARVIKEGLSWINPHPSRLFWDINHPLNSLNSDSGAEYVGYWEVLKYKDIADNPAFFNRSRVSYTDFTTGLFGNNNAYWSQYYSTVVAPPRVEDLTSFNDRRNQIGLYNSEYDDSSIFVSEFYWKIIPKEYGIGDYPYPVWVHFKIASEDTIIFAEIMPSSPAAVYSFNENDNRLVNISIAHELMGFQDQLTNLFSQLLETAKADLFAVAVLNSDIFPDDTEGQKLAEEFRATMKGENFYATTHVLEASFSRLRELGIDTNADNIFKVVRSGANTNLQSIFSSIVQVMSMAERLMALSPQEQGQPSPRETSATEVQVIANTTESVYGFISDAIDEGRAAVKRICYESLIACGSNHIYLPVLNRYPASVVEAAGFRVADAGDMFDPQSERRYTVIGEKHKLIHDYVFNSRDGSERSSNMAAANILTQMLPILQNPQLLQALTKEKYYEILNAIFRNSGAGVDLNLQLQPGEDNTLVPQEQQDAMANNQQNNQEMGAILQQLIQVVQQNSEEIESMKTGSGGEVQEEMQPVAL
tara:strand:+ start:363 stop:2684 length:2322 start_codon:yes stop_codon:yes gene_type:complete